MKHKLANVNFENKTIFVGIDVHQKQWHVTAIIDSYQHSNTFVPEPRKFADYLKKEYPGATFKAAYEAGCFGFWIKEQLEAEGIETIVINPGDIPTSDKDKKTKTDKIDSKKIAQSLMAGLVGGIYAPDRETQEERCLVRQRESIVKKSTRVKNQIKANLKYFGITLPEAFEDTKLHWSRKYIAWLGTVKYETESGAEVMQSLLRELEFLRVEKLRLARLIRALSKNKKYAENKDIVIGVPGIGLTGAMTILTEVIDIGRFKGKDEFLCYLGLSPSEHSSGEKRRIGHMTKRCNHSLRNIFIEGAWVAIRHDPALALYFGEVSKKIGKTKAIIKVARKLATRTRHVWRTKEKYVLSLVA